MIFLMNNTILSQQITTTESLPSRLTSAITTTPSPTQLDDGDVPWNLTVSMLQGELLQQNSTIGVCRWTAADGELLNTTTTTT